MKVYSIGQVVTWMKSGVLRTGQIINHDGVGKDVKPKVYEVQDRINGMIEKIIAVQIIEVSK